MALWGTDETKTPSQAEDGASRKAEEKPTWLIDRDPDGSKGRPLINDQRNAFAANTGWVKRVTKTLPDGTVRLIDELLVATNKAEGDSPSILGLNERLGVANITSVDFRDLSIAANSMGYFDQTANVLIDVSFNEEVDFIGAQTLTLSNDDTSITATAYPGDWDGLSSIWHGRQNNSNMITYTVPVGVATTGNGELTFVTGLTLSGTITDNIGGGAAIKTTTGATRIGNNATGNWGPGVAVLSTANTIILGTIEGV